MPLCQQGIKTVFSAACHKKNQGEQKIRYREATVDHEILSQVRYKCCYQHGKCNYRSCYPCKETNAYENSAAHFCSFCDKRHYNRHGKMQFLSKPVFKECPVLWMKNDVDNRRIACSEHSVTKPDPDQQEKDVPCGFFIVEFVVHNGEGILLPLCAQL